MVEGIIYDDELGDPLPEPVLIKHLDPKQPIVFFARCKRCNRMLKSAKAMKIGYGHACLKKMAQEKFEKELQDMPEVPEEQGQETKNDT
jgi:hypothetical protein